MEAIITLFILLFAVVMFVAEKIPLSLTALIVSMALTISGVLTAGQAFAGFVNPAVIVFVAMFVVGGAFYETGMAAKMGEVLTRYAKTERQVIVTIMLSNAALGTVLSNTATAAVFIPIVIGIADRTNISRAKLLMPMAFTATMGGRLTLIGTPGNLIAHALLEEHDGLGFNFFDFAFIGLPMLFVGILYFAFIGHKLLPNTPNDKGEGGTADGKIGENVPKWKQRLATITLVGIVVGMVFSEQLGVPIHVIAVVGAIFLVLTGVMSEKQAYSSIDLRVIFLFGGTLPLATALETSGAGMMIADTVIRFLGEGGTPFVVMAAIFLLGVVLSNFISSTATIALLTPIAISIATSMGADPRAAAMAAVMGGTMGFATPVATPPNTMVLTAGGYRFTDYVKAGTPLLILGSITCLIFMMIFFPFFP